MDNTTKLLLQLCCSVIKEAPLQNLPPLEEEDLKKLYALAKKHELAHLAAEGLKQAGVQLPGELRAKFRKQRMAAIYSDETKDQALEQAEDCLTNAKIPYLPLKGSKLREYYPQTWMRSRGDIDVLVHREQHDAARMALEAAGFELGSQWHHDVTLISPGGVHLELHHSLLTEHDYVKQSYLETIWDSAKPAAEGSFCHVLDDAMFYCYHVSHMAKHMRSNGCGLRPFLDLWILNHLQDADHEGRAAMLQEVGLEAFARTAGILADSWFDETVPASPLARELEDYIVSCGIFGNKESSASNWRVSPNQMLLQRIFAPYSRMALEYPAVKKHPWLYPVYHFVRWWDVLRRSGAMAGFRRWNGERKIYQKNEKELHRFMDDLGLNT